ncbi:MAG TPA: polysaccharide deacetylase family protein, partial [Bacillota bacterium]|nr:polysaccharide deacetylase family protein [Bacillota bacterium]
MSRSRNALFASVVMLIILSSSFLGKDRQRKDIIHSIPTQEKIVALTYDDGPHPIYTPQILGILKEHHVKATFFM